MTTIWIREFTGGLDTRRMPETTPGGALIRAVNGHINRGGEFEKRAAFVPVYQLPPGATRGIARGTGDDIVVFGHEAEPSGLPAGVKYVRLEHPTDSAVALQQVLSTTSFASKLYVVALFADGSRHHYYDGAYVPDWFDGRARASFRIIGGSAGGSAQVDSITVDGVAIIGSAVAWATSNVATASAVASAINSFSSSPNYTAVASGDRVNIVAADAGTAANGRPVEVTTSGDMVVTPTTDILMSGGGDTDDTFIPGTYVKTVGSKVYSVSGPNFHFSGVAAPTQWTTDAVGAGFVDMSSQADGAEELQAIERYQEFVAIFAQRTTLIFFVDPDPTLNRLVQVLNNTGTRSPRSVTPFGDNDIFYLDESGVRSLRARDSSNAAATTDIGIPVDTVVIEALSALTSEQRRRVYGLIEPRDGRFWLCMLDRIFVFSFFPGSRISAWSVYEPDFTIDDTAVSGRRVYLRSGDTIYAYGGEGAMPQYDDTEAEVWLPYLDADAPERPKRWTAIDAAVEGEWETRVGLDPTNLGASDVVGRIGETTFGNLTHPAMGESTHVSLRFRSMGDGPARVSSAVIRAEQNES